MLTWTSNAAVVIRSLIGDSGLSEGSGLRLVIHPQSRSLVMSLAPGPTSHDDVLTRHGVRVFLDPAAAARLREQTLDARITGDEQRFFLTT
ncbi:MAG: Fe-S cluster assembly protein HesB [Actinomycetota bacterium]|nr:Fe-S cluster assembly protein HesB [Actinomycetota bacterium]